MIDTDNKGEWRVRLDRPVCADCIEIWIYRHTKRGDVDIAQPNGTMWRLLEGAIKPPECKPTLTLSGFEGKQLMHALAEALAEEGIKTPDSHLLQGQLDAQTAHLKDLRSLLKLK